MGTGRSMVGRGRSMVGRGRSHQQAEAMRPETEQWISVRGGMDKQQSHGNQKPPPAAEVLGADSDPVLFPWGLPSPTPIPGVHWVSWSLVISPVTLGGTRHGFILLKTKATLLQSA